MGRGTSGRDFYCFPNKSNLQEKMEATCFEGDLSAWDARSRFPRSAKPRSLAGLLPRLLA